MNVILIMNTNTKEITENERKYKNKHLICDCW